MYIATNHKHLGLKKVRGESETALQTATKWGDDEYVHVTISQE